VRHDVIILGSGLGGSTIGAVLARHGHRVLMVEKGRHPRFALGEATLPQTSYWLWLISQRYDVPEIGVLADARTVASKVAPSSGIKRSIGFAYHRPGEDHDMRRESHQVLAPELPFISESHLFREDIDLYLARVAQGYGAELIEDSQVVDVDVSDDDVSVRDASGAVHRARYLVDASGFASVVATTFGLRENPTRLRTRSRSIFTHVDGLRPFDDLFGDQELPGLKYRWHDGTLHHVFDGGWFWVIPFGNHGASRNSKASVGLTLDMRKYPVRDGVSAEREFTEFVSRFPSVARHLDGAVATRPYISTGRLQYSSTHAVGTRFFVTPQAYGAVDALYSRGLINSFETTYRLLAPLMTALDDDDFAPQRFAGLDELARDQLDTHDLMVASAYRSMADFEAWNAWLKVWLASKLFGDIWLLRTTMRYLATGDRAHLAELDRAVPAYAEPMRRLVETSSAALASAEAGGTWAEAAAVIHDALQGADWLPNFAYPWDDPSAHHGDFTPAHVMPLTLLWGKTRAPSWARRHLFDFPTRPLVTRTVADRVSHLTGGRARRSTSRPGMGGEPRPEGAPRAVHAPRP
jgi:FADH2 O2-dependent halogenase